MDRERKIGVFGIGPGSIAAIDTLRPAVVFQRERSASEKRSIYTTARNHERLFEKYVPQEALMPMTEIRVLTHYGTDFTLPFSDTYYMVDYPAVMNTWQERVTQSAGHIETLPASIKKEDIRVKENDGTVSVGIQGGYYEFDAVVDSTGTAAAIASQVESARHNEDFLAEYVCAGTFRGSVPEGQMLLVFGPAGGTSWVNPSIYKGPGGEPLVDVVFSGYGYKSRFDTFKSGDGRKRLDKLVDFVSSKDGIEIYNPEPIDVTYGMIRSQITPKPVSETVFATGEAGGTAQPLAGESFNRALNAGLIAAETILDEGLPADYYDAFRAEYPGHDTLFSYTYNRIGKQNKGTIGDRIHRGGVKWLESGKADPTKFKQDLEQFILGGKLPRSLMMRFMTDPEYVIGMLSTLKTMALVKLKGPDKLRVPKGYSFGNDV